MIPRFTSCSAGESTLVSQATQLFSKNGCLLLDDVFPEDLIHDLRNSFHEQYASYLREADHQDALAVGDKRYMVTVELKSPFNTPLLYANSFVLPIVRGILGDDCVLRSLVCVVALPGSKLQHRHRDGRTLFSPFFPNHILPMYALNLFIPLVELNEQNGSTRLWPGTHRQAIDEEPKFEGMAPQLRSGSCGLFDYRLLHQGTENRGNQPRPILFLVYSRPWFLDHRNYMKQPLLRISPEEYRRAPESCRSLLEWMETSGLRWER